MTWIAVGGTALSAVGTLWSSSSQKSREAGNRRKNAAMQRNLQGKQKKYMQNAIYALNQGADAYRKELQPYTELQRYNPLFEYLSTGVMTPEVQTLIGGSDVNSFIANSPAAAYERAESEKALNRQLGARGMWNSTAGVNALAANNRAIESNAWQNYYDRIGRIYGTALQAKNNLADMEFNLGTNKGNVYTGGASQIINSPTGFMPTTVSTGENLGGWLSGLGGMVAGGGFGSGQTKQNQQSANNLQGGSGYQSGYGTGGYDPSKYSLMK